MITVTINYDQEAYALKYEELKKYRATIPPDPMAQGFNGLAQLISTIQGYKDRVSELLSEALVLKSQAKVQAESAKYKYETSLDLIMDTDIEILALPSDRTRLARANKKLTVEVAHMRESNLIYRLIDAYFKTVENAYNNLESSNRNISEQCNLYKKMYPSNDQSSGSPKPFQGSTSGGGSEIMGQVTL